jgi:hypothetical protein
LPARRFPLPVNQQSAAPNERHRRRNRAIAIAPQQGWPTVRLSAEIGMPSADGIPLASYYPAGIIHSVMPPTADT